MSKKRDVVFDDELSAKERQQFTEVLEFNGWSYVILWHGSHWRVTERVRSQEGRRGFSVQKVT